MSLATQNRPPLTDTVQQFANLPAGALLALQIQEFTDDGTLAGTRDYAKCDADGGSFTLTLPNGAEVVLGKPYLVRETGGTNSITVDAAGAGTINGSPNITLGAGECVQLMPETVSDAGLVTWATVGSQPPAADDSDALHVNVSGEIHALTNKAIPILTDEVVGEDAANSWSKIRIAVGNLFKTVGWIAGLTAKTAPVAADSVAISDSAASDAPKKSTLAQFFAAIGGLTAKASPVAADGLVVTDSAASGAAKTSTVGSVVSLAAGILLEPAADAAITLLGSTGAVVFQTASGATTVIANGAGLYAGQEVKIFASAVAGGGKATLVVQGGALTVDAVDEAPLVKRNAANDAWVVIDKGGATIV
jgi:hypothetical protein